MSTFDTDIRPKHDPDSCERVPCGKCRPQGQSRAPGIIPNPHDAAPPRRMSMPKHLDPSSIVAALRALANDLETHGDETWHRVADWTPEPKIPTYPGPEDGERPSRSVEDERDRMENAKAGRYLAELQVLAPRIYADVNRFRSVIEIASRPNRKGSVSNLQGCELCAAAGVKRDGKPVPFDHRSNVGERLPRDMFLCQPHYLYVQRHDSAPTEQQTRHWSATGTWRVKA